MTDTSGTSRDDAQEDGVLRAGNHVLIGRQLVTVSGEFAKSLQPGDEVLGIGTSGELRRLPSAVVALVSGAVTDAHNAFRQMSNVDDAAITDFFAHAGRLLEDDATFEIVRQANETDVASAKSRGRSTTRLVLSESMRADMVAALHMWETLDLATEQMIDVVQHEGWQVQQWRSPLGVLGFVFEGRPNVFADATGVLRAGNTVVFRIGSDALGTARALMAAVIEPALSLSGLPVGAVRLIDSTEHAAGWALFSDSRLSLAVARGSGEAVAELGAIAQQSGVPVSLHGTGGAWIIASDTADNDALGNAVEYSLDRKVCNTLNVVCVTLQSAPTQVPIIFAAAERAASQRSTEPRIHCVGGAEKWLNTEKMIDVIRAEGTVRESQVTVASPDDLSCEFEWEATPELFIVVVHDIEEAIELCNAYSPQFVVSVITQDEDEREMAWSTVNAPFFGNGFTRWVDGQFALQRPELGLSNWQNGRLFGRAGVLSGDSAFTIRLRVVQERTDIHR